MGKFNQISKSRDDVAFLKTDSARSLRMHLEFLKPYVLQKKAGIKSTIVVFGSAQIPSASQAKAALSKANKALKAHPRNKKFREKMTEAKRDLSNSQYYEEARKFAKIVATESKKYNLVIATGGGPGVMEGANRGAWEAKAKTIGYNIDLPHEQKPNPFISPELCFQFRYFALRKMHFLMPAKALIVFPGGFGTMDELFEILTLVQTQRIKRIPIILLSRLFWQKAIDFDYMANCGMIEKRDLNLFQYAETAEEIWEKIKKFYKKRKT
jgi:uncharacterized protein (TIGR00730 family)